MADNPGKQPAKKPVKQPDEQPNDEPANKIAAKPTQKPVETVIELSAEQPIEQPAQVPAEEPAEQSAEQPADQLDTQTPVLLVKKPSPQPPARQVKKTTEQPLEQFADKSIEQPAGCSSKQAANEPEKRAAIGPVKQAANGSVKQAANGSVKQAAHVPAGQVEQPGPSRSESDRFRFFEDNFFARNAPSMTSELQFRSSIEARECFSNINKNINMDTNLANREHGLSDSLHHRLRGGLSTGFERRYHGSCHTLRKLKRVAALEAGQGRFEEKALHFSRVGNLLLFNSPRAKCFVVQIWDYQKKRRLYSYSPDGERAHLRITDAKFLNISTAVVTVCEAGSQKLGMIPPSGGEIVSINMYRCSMSSGRLGLCPYNPYVYYSASTNGDIGWCDIRAPPGKVIKSVTENDFYGLLFSVSHHPVKAEICVGSSDNKIRIFDLRNLKVAVAELCPQRIISEGFISLTCRAEYSCTGNEILASYSYEDHYLLNNLVHDQPNSYLQRYTGHYPRQSIGNIGFASNARFWGPNCEYVMASSEFCGIYAWETATGKFAGMLGEDKDQEYFDMHPSLPILATFSRTPHNIVRVWQPRLSSSIIKETQNIK